VLWLGLLSFLFGGSAEVLLHTGGLEPRTFATCSVIAVVLDAVLLIVIAATSIRRSWRRGSPAKRERFAVRHPISSQPSHTARLRPRVGFCPGVRRRGTIAFHRS
jgi:hypothetical protein